MNTIRRLTALRAAHALIVCFTALCFTFAVPGRCNGQITDPRILSAAQVKVPTLEEYLINRLKATKGDQKSYVKAIAKLVEQKKLEKRLVLALERRAQRKSPGLPLLQFERSLRVEAAKRRITVPKIADYTTRQGIRAGNTLSDTRVRY